MALVPDDQIFREIVGEEMGGVVLTSKIQDVTPDEIREAEAVFAATGACDHALVYDTIGYAYDIRTCAICGTGRGLV